jgi:hypothetical protein
MYIIQLKKYSYFQRFLMTDNLDTPLNHEALIHTATYNLSTIINLVFEHTDKERAVVVYDKNSLLSNVLSQAYKLSLPNATFIDFDDSSSEKILHTLNSLQANDFVALVQSTNFRLDAFRIRVELFKKKIKVIEHPHLSRIKDEDALHYINALEYNPEYFRGVGNALKVKIDTASLIIIDSGGEFLVYNSAFESAKLNIGDYTNMPNIGGQFPIGEVFTEIKDFDALNGRVRIFIFGDENYKINMPKTPITLIIEKSQVIACENSTPEFDEILFKIRRDEGTVWVRELGFGLNPAFSKTKRVDDIGSYERMCGVHLSLGAKHGMYAKPGFKRRDGIYHVDVFADTQSLTIEDEVVYKNEAWIIQRIK